MLIARLTQRIAFCSFAPFHFFVLDNGPTYCRSRLNKHVWEWMAIGGVRFSGWWEAPDSQRTREKLYWSLYTRARNNVHQREIESSYSSFDKVSRTLGHNHDWSILSRVRAGGARTPGMAASRHAAAQGVGYTLYGRAPVIPECLTWRAPPRFCELSTGALGL
jgi:hypothetical protein